MFNKENLFCLEFWINIKAFWALPYIARTADKIITHWFIFSLVLSGIEDIGTKEEVSIWSKKKNPFFEIFVEPQAWLTGLGVSFDVQVNEAQKIIVMFSFHMGNTTFRTGVDNI